MEDHSQQSLQQQTPVPNDVELKAQPAKVAQGINHPLDTKESQFSTAYFLRFSFFSLFPQLVSQWEFRMATFPMRTVRVCNDSTTKSIDTCFVHLPDGTVQEKQLSKIDIDSPTCIQGNQLARQCYSNDMHSAIPLDTTPEMEKDQLSIMDGITNQGMYYSDAWV
jgi:hypothetical protein